MSFVDERRILSNFSSRSLRFRLIRYQTPSVPAQVLKLLVISLSSYVNMTRWDPYLILLLLSAEEEAVRYCQTLCRKHFRVLRCSLEMVQSVSLHLRVWALRWMLSTNPWCVQLLFYYLCVILYLPEGFCFNIHLSTSSNAIMLKCTNMWLWLIMVTNSLYHTKYCRVLA